MGSMGSDDESYTNGHFVSGETKGKVINCKAAVVWGPEEPLVIEEVQVDPPKKLEVRIKILYTSICHTDLTVWKGEVIKKEIVESVGEGVLDMQEGDHVIPIFNGECGDCSYCKSEKTNLCEKYRVNPMKSLMEIDGKTRFSTKDGKPIYHFLNTSTFSEYTVIDSACVVKIDSNASMKKMSLLSCGVSTGNLSDSDGGVLEFGGLMFQQRFVM
ncbi:alcohol dehydrogenase [Thalictrum thalictroides]|uniref:Alcohol dehydrogenase n=1 Tax=Thalictrum thalictroides TaxID=46969 RepID=A0A7J6W0R4_THATH|nr:alcohol dehydrogenase [Thalictrum thalictroides]